MKWTLPLAVDQEGQALASPLDHKPLSSNFVLNLIEATSNAASLKDVQTKKYILGNLPMARTLGLNKSDQLAGLKVEDFCQENSGFFKKNFGRKFEEWRNNQPQRFNKLDYKVENQREWINVKYIYFSFEGFICIDKQTKIPVYDSDNKKVIAIFSYSEDTTTKESLPSLFKLYREYYPDKQAIQQLSKYLKIDSYFINPPTVKELDILFAMYQHTSRKRIGRCLNISENTVASHIQHMKDKLIKPDFDDLLIQLRKTISANTDVQYT